MAHKRSDSDSDESARVKRVKVESNGDTKPNMKAESNPYLAHWNSPAKRTSSLPPRFDCELMRTIEDPSNSADLLYQFKRHATTAKEAKAAEDGPLNPFTGQKLSSNYMSILKKRRDLPVHVQRYDAYPT